MLKNYVEKKLIKVILEKIKSKLNKIYLFNKNFF